MRDHLLFRSTFDCTYSTPLLPIFIHIQPFPTATDRLTCLISSTFSTNALKIFTGVATASHRAIYGVIWHLLFYYLDHLLVTTTRPFPFYIVIWQAALSAVHKQYGTQIIFGYTYFGDIKTGDLPIIGRSCILNAENLLARVFHVENK